MANRIRLGPLSYKPYLLMSDLAGLASLTLAWMFAVRFAEISFIGLVAGIGGALLVYKLVREVKARIGAISARSFLQDCVLVIIPAFLAINLAFGNSIALVTAFLGLLLPLYGGIARMGCFLGGCCYGRPWRGGISYPPAMFQSRSRGWRRFSPGPDPGQRVFPIQLVEATAQLVLFASLAALLWSRPDWASSILLLYLALYTVLRFGLDFFRTTSARPRRGRFSEAQLVCATVLIVASLGLGVVQVASGTSDTAGARVAYQEDPEARR